MKKIIFIAVLSVMAAQASLEPARNPLVQRALALSLKALWTVSKRPKKPVAPTAADSADVIEWTVEKYETITFTKEENDRAAEDALPINQLKRLLRSLSSQLETQILIAKEKYDSKEALEWEIMCLCDKVKNYSRIYKISSQLLEDINNQIAKLATHYWNPDLRLRGDILANLNNEYEQLISSIS